MRLNDLNKVERTVTLDFDKSYIMSNIKNVCECSSSKINVLDENEMFGTIRISINAGILQFIIINITITENDTKSNLSFSAYNAGGGSLPLSSINVRVDEFFKKLSLSLSGEILPKEETKNLPTEENTDSGVIVFISIIVLIVFIAFCFININ